MECPHGFLSADKTHRVTLMKTLTKAVMAIALTGTAAMSYAAEVDIEITNLTTGTYFTPLLIAAHGDNQVVFEPGVAATAELQAMAEGGDISGIADALTATGAVLEENPAAGLLMPGASTMVTLNTDNASGNDYLSIVAMLLPTNDGFVGLSHWEIPTEPGVYPISLNAYDAGTEANDEIRGSGAPGEAGLPVPPPLEDSVGMGGTGVSAEAEGFVHVHRGVLGDGDDEGGMSDIGFSQRWLNPVAQVVVTVK